jgi:hypothetical protein
LKRNLPKKDLLKVDQKLVYWHSLKVAQWAQSTGLNLARGYVQLREINRL